MTPNFIRYLDLKKTGAIQQQLGFLYDLTLMRIGIGLNFVFSPKVSGENIFYNSVLTSNDWNAIYICI